MSDDPRIVAYYEFVDFFKSAGIYTVQFRRPKDYAKLLALLGKEPGVKWTEDERRTLGYSLAWMHHKGRNRHHWEYWTDYSGEEKRYVPVPMPRRYMAEMICDRIAASKIYNGPKYTDASPLEYLQRGKMHDHMHPETHALLTRFMTQLRDEGEDAMFASLRRWVREKA